MNYKTMLLLVANEHNTTPDEAEKEIKQAIKAAGIDISPQPFIALCSAKAKCKIRK